jgi:hypothetical protein
MLRWIPALVSGLAMAVIAVAAFWLIDQSDQLNGVGQLQRQAGLIGSPWVWTTVGFFVGFALGVSQSLKSQRDTRQVQQQCQELAQRLSQHFSPTYAIPEAAQSMPVFGALVIGSLANRLCQWRPRRRP